eukprot:Tamp_16778.p1 GENE.Tamp_16778~~Tamp_16778.p1  ORF type:complete len:458 (+),score=84.75 Tamp_16778:26-1375(+)
MSDGSEDDDVGAVVVVPAQATLLEALHPARGEDDDYDVPRVAAASASLSITVTHGAHNLTDAGELALCRRVQLAASPGVTLAAYAQPPPRGEIFPEVGGGRLHFMEGSTGSTLSGIQMTSVNLQCAIICSSAVLFDRCELRTWNGNSDVSVLFIDKAGHATITSSVLGGVTVHDTASQAVVVYGSGAEAVIAHSVLENCYASTIIVCNNATARLSACTLRDSYAGCAILDDNVPLGSTVLEAGLDMYNIVVQCAGGLWRDDCRPKRFLEVNTTYEEYEFKELAEHDFDGREGRIVVPKMRWDSDRNAWNYAGMTKETRQRYRQYYETFRPKDTVDPRQLYAQVRKELGKRSWESSSEEGNEQNNKLVDLDAWQDSSSNGGEMVARQRRQQGVQMKTDMRHRSKIAGSLAERYASAHGHPGNPPVPKNKYFSGVTKSRSVRKGRRSYKHH